MTCVRATAKAARALGLAVGLCLAATGMARRASADEVEVSETARELFREGVGHLKAEPPRFAEAYEAFKRAYEDSPSPKILGNLGFAATMLERDGEAIAAYRRYLDEAGAKSDREQRQIKADLEALEARVSRLRLSVSPRAVTIVDRRANEDGSVVENRYDVSGGEIELGLRAGKHRLTVAAEGHLDHELEIDLEPGASASKKVTLALQAEEGASAPPPLPIDSEPEQADAPAIGMWVAVGATGALAIATGVVGGLAAANHSSFEEATAAGDAARAADLRDGGETLNITGDVLLGATLVAGAVSVVLIALELTDDEEDVVAAPFLTREGVTMGLFGRF